MERFFKRKVIDQQENQNVNPQRLINVDDLPTDPGLRKNINDYDPNDREKVRRWYLQKKAFQPKDHNFPTRVFGKETRRFIRAWFQEYSYWLEYSIVKDAAFCLCCYLFKPEHGEQGGGDAFVSGGFTNWKHKDRLDVHVGTHNSVHNQCLKACIDLMNQKQHIEVALCAQSDQVRLEYHTRLKASVDCIRFLLMQGLAFRGHDESFESNNRGNFLELLQFLADHNEKISKGLLQNAPDNLKLVAPSIQKDIVQAAATETTNVITKAIRQAKLFSILVDEARDSSVKEQMAIVLRYVDEKGKVIECFLGIVHVENTAATSLKAAVESSLAKNGLSISSLRGQGYDGASNMQGEFNGLKTLIMTENSSAYYVHCFAHQLQLTLIAVAKKHNKVCSFFSLISIITNVVGASCKRRDILRDKQHAKVIEEIYSGEVLTGRGLNQERALTRAGDTRWNSHFRTLLNLISLFPSVVDVLEVIEKDGNLSEHRCEASDLLEAMQCFEFVFLTHLMKTILGITNELSQALQRNDQDLVNAMTLVKVSKIRLQAMRDNGWDSILREVTNFCQKNDIIVLNMEDIFVARGRSRRKSENNTNLHIYRVELFYSVIDLQLTELNSRFDEVNTELLLCMACLDPSNNFSAFDKQKLIGFAEHYPLDFSPINIMELDNQLESYILDVRSNREFSDVKGLGGLAQKLVQLKKDVLYPLLYLLIKLALLLPVATASVERAFSAMKIIKTSLRNRMGDDWMNACLVTYIEKDIFSTIDNKVIMECFQNMKDRR